MKLRLFLVGLLVIVLLCACENVKGITGTVTNGVAGQPLEGASIELFRCSEAGCEERLSSQTTGADGRYNFPDVTAGTYLLSIVWADSPPCPGIAPFQTMGARGDFTVAYAGYGGIGGFGPTRMIATREVELPEGGGMKADLEFACP